MSLDASKELLARGLVPARASVWDWAKVASTTPLRVVLDGTVFEKDVAANGAGPLAIDDRVLVRSDRGHVTVVSRAGGTAGTALATANRLVARDANGNAQFADPLAAADADTMGARDAAILAATRGQVPSSVVVGAGSASVAADATVAFTAVSSVSLNDVFDGLGGDMYEVTAWTRRTAGAVVGFRLRDAGTDLAGTSYTRTAVYSQLASGPTRASASGVDAFGFLIPTGAGSAAEGFGTLRLGRPGTTDITLHTMHSSSDPNGDRYEWSESGQAPASACDGITLFVASGLMTGWMKVEKVA